MSCPPVWRLAAAASGDDAVAAAHGEHCIRCAALLDEQREISRLARHVPAPVLGPLSPELAAELMASEPLAPPRARPIRWLAGAGIGLAAALAIMLGRPHHEPAKAVSRAPVAPAISRSTTEFTPDAALPAPPATPPDVPLRDGKLALDTRGGAVVNVVKNGATVAIASGRAEISSRGGVIVAVRVFAGSVEITDRAKPIVIVAGDVWIRPEPPEHKQPASTPPPEPATSLSLFRTGWEELHAGHDAEALAAFDHAIDPVIREDALYWAATAADRAGDRDGAVRRLHEFLDQFPDSPRAEDARATLVRLTPR